MLASTLPTPKIKDFREANAALRRLLANDISIKIRPMPIDDPKGLTFSDASLGNAPSGGTQVSYIACATSSRILAGSEVDASIIAFENLRMTRSASNVLYTESFSLSDALAFMEWMTTWFGLARDPKFILKERDSVNREIEVQLPCQLPNPLSQKW